MSIISTQELSYFCRQIICFYVINHCVLRASTASLFKWYCIEKLHWLSFCFEVAFGKGYRVSEPGHYEATCTTGSPMTVAGVWCDSEETRFLGAGAGTQGRHLQRRKRSKGKTSGHGKRAR